MQNYDEARLTYEFDIRNTKSRVTANVPIYANFWLPSGEEPHNLVSLTFAKRQEKALVSLSQQVIL